MAKRGKVVASEYRPDPYEEVRCRKIENGHVVTHSGFDGKKHFSKETYHKENPLKGIKNVVAGDNKLMEKAGGRPKR